MQAVTIIARQCKLVVGDDTAVTNSARQYELAVERWELC